MAFLGCRITDDDKYRRWQEIAALEKKSLSRLVEDVLTRELTVNGAGSSLEACPVFDPFGPECVYRRSCHRAQECLIAWRERKDDLPVTVAGRIRAEMMNGG